MQGDADTASHTAGGRELHRRGGRPRPQTRGGREHRTQKKIQEDGKLQPTPPPAGAPQRQRPSYDKPILSKPRCTTPNSATDTKAVENSQAPPGTRATVRNASSQNMQGGEGARGSENAKRHRGRAPQGRGEAHRTPHWQRRRACRPQPGKPQSEGAVGERHDQGAKPSSPTSRAAAARAQAPQRSPTADGRHYRKATPPNRTKPTKKSAANPRWEARTLARPTLGSLGRPREGPSTPTHGFQTRARHGGLGGGLARVPAQAKGEHKPGARQKAGTPKRKRIIRETEQGPQGQRPHRPTSQSGRVMRPTGGRAQTSDTPEPDAHQRASHILAAPRGKGIRSPPAPARATDDRRGGAH